MNKSPFIRRLCPGLPRAACAAAMTLLAAGGVRAQEPPTAAELQQRLQQLEQRHKALQEEFEKQKQAKDKEAEERKKKEGQKKEEEKAKPDKSSWLEVGKDLKLNTSWANGFVAETADQAFRLHCGGRLDFDNTWFTQDNNILIGPSPTTRMSDGSLFRRARLRADGRVWEFIDF